MLEDNGYNQFIRAAANKLRDGDQPPKSKADWDARRKLLRDKMFAAMGAIPEKDAPLEAKLLGVLNRDGYRIEKLTLQTRPGVYMTASAYVPELPEGKKAPAVLVVHGHWPFARRDPVVQSRSIGLAKLGFFVLAVDAFGAGERFTNPARGTYHGALYGSTLWPTGATLLGMQVYDNRRAVDYLLTRSEVNGKFGVTGASGGGNQTMYAGALDERFGAVVPVCSVGNYRAYLRAACCVCEVLPAALSFTEEREVLGLVAPRALFVINASKDGIQFSPAEAEKSVAGAAEIFKVYGAGDKLRHRVFESPHDYNKAMREAMYGWMTLHLKGEGKGEPIPEPKFDLEKPEDLACYPDPADRPKGFLFPTTFADAEAKAAIAKADKHLPTHKQMWEATAVNLRKSLLEKLGDIPTQKQKDVRMEGTMDGGIWKSQYRLSVEGGLQIAVATRGPKKGDQRSDPLAILLHFDGIDAAANHPIVKVLGKKSFNIVMPELRATGKAKYEHDAVGGAPDHNSAEHGVWIGRPLLSQWLTDVRVVLDYLQANQKRSVHIVGIGPAGTVALFAAACFPDEISKATVIDAPVSYRTDTAYGSGTPMGLLVPGILQVGDIPHVAGLIAPRPLLIAGGATMQGRKLDEKELTKAFDFTRKVYTATESANALTIAADVDWEKATS